MTERTAEDAYREHLTAIRENLGAISVAVDDHVLADGIAPHWGHVGDLTRLEEILTEARRFIRNEEDCP